jgi:hypothetical protein
MTERTACGRMDDVAVGAGRVGAVAVVVAALEPILIRDGTKDVIVSGNEFRCASTTAKAPRHPATISPPIAIAARIDESPHRKQRPDGRGRRP